MDGFPGSACSSEPGLWRYLGPDRAVCQAWTLFFGIAGTPVLQPGTDAVPTWAAPIARRNA